MYGADGYLDHLVARVIVDHSLARLVGVTDGREGLYRLRTDRSHRCGGCDGLGHVLDRSLDRREFGHTSLAGFF
jgi:hypothetical protein